MFSDLLLKLQAKEAYHQFLKDLKLILWIYFLQDDNCLHKVQNWSTQNLVDASAHLQFLDWIRVPSEGEELLVKNLGVKEIN